MHYLTRALLIYFLTSGLSISGAMAGETPQSMLNAIVSQQVIQAGRESFLLRCSGCHGEKADGKGPGATMLSPKPRNLVEGSFKFRSTPSGTLPTVSDLIQTIDRGVRMESGFVMPPFSDLPSGEKLALVAYIRSLRKEFLETKKEQLPVFLPAPPPEVFSTKTGLIAAAQRGKVLYTQACLMCHGESGRGDGPSAAELTDSDNYPILPANLTSPHLKTGPTAKDAFRGLSTGLDGSPMPGFRDTFSEAQRWDLVAFIFYLRGKEAGIYGDEDKLK